MSALDNRTLVDMLALLIEKYYLIQKEGKGTYHELMEYKKKIKLLQDLIDNNRSQPPNSDFGQAFPFSLGLTG